LKLSWQKQLALSLRQKPNPDEPLRLAVLGVGSEINGDDAVGVLAVRRLHPRFGSCGRLLLREAGLAPENFSAPLRRFAPHWVVLIDAAEMDETPGTIGWFDWRVVGAGGGSTHSLPLSVFGGFLATELGCQVGLLGVQPARIEMDAPLTLLVRAALRRLTAGLGRILEKEMNDARP